MELIPSLPKYLAISLAVSLGFYFTGHVLLSFFRQDAERSKAVFLKFSLGLIVWVISFAVWYSSFRTIMTGALLVLLYSIFYFQRNKSISLNFFKENFRKVEWKHISILLVIIIIISLYFVERYGIQLRRIHDDLVYYAGIADYIKLTKVETNSFNIIDLPQTPSFYHYFDSWLIVLLRSVLKVSSLNLLVYSILPIYCSILIVGATALSETYFPAKKWFIYPLIGASFIFISTFEEFLNPIYQHLGFDSATNRAYADVSNYKLAVVNICLIWFFINLKTRDIFKVFLPLCLVSILYPLSLPGIFGGSIVFLGVELTKKKKIKNSGWLPILIFVPLLFLSSFYLVSNFQHQPNGLKYTLIDTLKDNYDSIRAIFKSLSVFVTFTLRVLLGFSIYLFFYLAFYWKDFKQMKDNPGTTIVLSMYVASLLLTCSIFYLQNSFQFNTNLLRPAINIICYLLILKLLFDTRIFLRFAGFVLIILNIIYHQPSRKRLDAKLDIGNYSHLEAEFKSNDFKTAYFKGPSSYNTIFDKSINFSIPFPNIRRFSDNYFPVCLSVFDIPEPKTINDKYIVYTNLNESPFYAYVIENNLEENISMAQYSFMQLHKIDYIIVEQTSDFYKNLPLYNIAEKISLDNEDFDIFKVKWD